MKNDYTAEDLSKTLKVHISTIHRISKKHNWQYEERPNPKGGGTVKHFLSSSFDEDTRSKLIKKQLQEVKDVVAVPTVYDTPSIQAPVKRVDVALPESSKKQALTKYDLVRLYVDRVDSAPYGDKGRVRESFVETYNTGLLYPQLYRAIGPVHWSTLEAWRRELKATGNDCFVLADRRGAWKRGMKSLNETHEKILLSCLLHPNKPKIAESIRFAREIMDARGIRNGFSDATYRRWIQYWKERNYHIWTFTREGWKAWNDKCALSAERDYDLISVGDVVVADGHVLNFEIINPWTGKPKRMVLILWLDMKSSFPLGWEIMPTENTQSIASALRWAIIRLGKIPKVAYIDNGKAFGAKFFEGQDLEAFTGLFERLGMNVIHARPYRGQSKTVERFFGTMSELERWAPTFTGTCIDDKPPGMMRGEKLHRKIREQMACGGITIEHAHTAVAEWFDRYVRRPQQSGHLAGITPLEVFMAERGPGIDRDLLNDLMMAMTVKSVRRSAISFNKRQYYHPDLHGRTHQVMVRYDLQDPSYIRVHELTGELICVAEPYEKIHPAAKVFGDSQQLQRLSEHCAEHRRQEKEASALAGAFLREEFLPRHREQLAAAGVETIPLMKKGKQQPVKQIPEKSSISDEEWAEIQAQADKAEVWIEEKPKLDLEAIAMAAASNVIEDAWALRERLEALPEPERYVEILEMEAKGMMVPEKWKDFKRYFEYTLEYLNNQDKYENIRGMLAVQWQSDAATGGDL